MKNLKILAKRINFHDPLAFKEAFLQYHKPLCLFAYSYLKDLKKSEDVVQDTFTKLWNDKVKMRSEVSLKSFLYLCVRNNCLNSIKHEARKSKIHEEYLYLECDFSENFEAMESDSLFEFNAMEADLCGRMNSFINELPSQPKKIMLLALEEKDNLEIAKKMNISVNTVKTHKRRAYKRLKERIKQFF